MILIVLFIAAIGLLIAWLVGGALLRLGGLILALAGVCGLAILGDENGILVLLVGAFLWLAGHWHYALRHQEYKSPLARYICRWAPAWLDPTRNWAVAVESDGRDDDSAGRGRRAT